MSQRRFRHGLDLYSNLIIAPFALWIVAQDAQRFQLFQRINIHFQKLSDIVGEWFQFQLLSSVELATVIQDMVVTSWMLCL